MNNREYLNTLSDEECSVETILQVQESSRQAQISAPYNCSQDQLYKLHCKEYANYLQAEHITTADEDFLEYGYVKTEQNEKFVIYKADENRDDNTEVYVYPIETKILIFPKNMVRYVLLEDNQIRTIAEKKRKEIGWDK